MAGYLDRIGAGKILVDRSPLSYDWTPNTLVGRDDSLSELASIFSQMKSGYELQGCDNRAGWVGEDGAHTGICKRPQEAPGWTKEDRAMY